MRSLLVPRLCLLLLPISSAAAVEPVAPPAARAAELLRAEIPGVEVAWHPATGVARTVRLGRGIESDLAPHSTDRREEERVRDFLRRHPGLFGSVDPDRELDLVDRWEDRWGFRHLAFAQFQGGVRVFGALLRAHFDPRGRLRSVHGTLVPELELDPRPTIGAAAAAAAARAFVTAEIAPPGTVLSSGMPLLRVHRPGLERARGGEALLVWAIEVGDGGTTRELVFVDARRGKVVDHLTRIADAMLRRAYSGVDQAPFDGIPDSWPDSPDWVEGDPYPTGNPELDGSLRATRDVYEFFAFLGRDSWDGEGGELDISWNHATFCPNASWNGRLASFCAGFSVHDVVVHEWGHAYGDRTHGLLYRWQSGALSESFSDLWGELLDRATTLGGVHDTDGPDLARAAGACSAFVVARLELTAPASEAGDRAVGTAAFGSPPAAMAPVGIVRALDGQGVDPADACEPLPGGSPVAGRIAFANRGDCDFQLQALHVQKVGAIGLVVGNLATSPDPETPPRMGCHPIRACDQRVTLPAVSLGASNAGKLRELLDRGPVEGALRAGDNQGSGESVRWILGEDVRPLGPARDMWTPTCFGHPGRVSDAEYFCGTADNGGVHVNSGVPNHAFALLVEGGSYNGRDVDAIGRTRAAHLYWRVESVYQTPTSDFLDHADALAAACDDLVGLSLPDPWGGSAQQMRPEDCAAVAEAVAAVELRATPACGFVPILEPDPPPLCDAQTPYPLSSFGFELGPEGWQVFRRAVADPSTFDPRDWTRVGALPDGRAGIAFLAPDPINGDCVTGQGGDDESGVLVLQSPPLVLPSGTPARFAFDHYVTTEATWDGGNVKLRVNDAGPWLVVPPEAYRFNPYNGELREPDLNTNPMAGEAAFHGTDEGSNAGSWGTSIVKLEGLVPPETPFRVRFELGTDRCFGSDLGWWVDDVRLAACASGDPLFLDGFGTGDASRWSLVQP